MSVFLFSINYIEKNHRDALSGIFLQFVLMLFTA
jgi:hypothetical protein